MIKTRAILLGVLFAFLEVWFVNLAAAAEPSTQEIIEKAKDAMNATMKYQVGAAGGAATTMVYQKALTNGITVSRYETSSGTAKLTYLFLSDGTFQLFPEVHGAIDVGFLAQAGQVPSVNPFAKISPGTEEWMGFTTYDDKICYKIRAHLTPINTSVIAMLPANTPIPDACQYLIETNTCRVLQVTMLHGNSTYANVEFRNFEVLPDLPGDFFIIPPDYKIEKATSVEQYSRMIMKYLVPGPKNIPKGFAFDPETYHIVKVDPKTGAFIPLTNTATSSDYLASSKSQKRIRAVILSILVISSVAFLAIIITSQCRRKKSD
jgi:hypothetical protein